MEIQDTRSKELNMSDANLSTSKQQRKNVGKGNQVQEVRISARWDSFLNLKFIEACEEEIGKGNRPNSHFNNNGWKNLVSKFNELTGRNYSYKQLRNHWDSMKKEWLLYQKLMYRETGIGWNPTNNSIDASDEWWGRKISENGDYSKFKNKDLSLIRFRYSSLFSDVAATGERARAPNQRSESEIQCNEDILEDNDELNYGNEPAEFKFGDEDDDPKIVGDNMNFEVNDPFDSTVETMFPSFAPNKRKSNGEHTRGRKRVSGAASLKEDIQSLLHFMENKNSSTSNTDITIGVAMQLLNDVPGLTPLSDIWNYACNLLSKQDMREVFFHQPSHESRLSWLQYNYEQYKKNA